MRANDLTGLIHEWQSGNEDALRQLMPLVHDELQRLARQQMRGETRSHTLQATALVNEAFMRLAQVEIDYQDRAHFMAMASRTMRRVLVDHARKKKSAKRGGDARDLTLDDSMAVSTDDPSILDLDNAIGKLAEVDERLASTIELVFFGGLTYEEAADVQGVSKTTLHDDLRLAKAWLKNYMSHADEQQGE